jgi:hypothetical protein
MPNQAVRREGRVMGCKRSGQALHVLKAKLVANINGLRYLRRALKDSGIGADSNKADACSAQYR